MPNLILFAIFLIGLTVGSFLNCIIHRLSRNESFLLGHSYCPHCQHILTWQDLIPVLSFLILKGRCRYCQQKISSQYPLVELATGIIFLLIFNLLPPQNFGAGFNEFSIFNFQKFLHFLYLLIISSLLIVIFVYDLKYYLIPDKVIYPAIILTLIFNFQFSIFKEFSILSAILAAGFFLLIVLVSRGRWMGVGDIKLAFLMGLFLGFPNILVALFLAFFIGAIIGIGLILAGKKSLKSEIPFGPFLVTGTFIAFFWGQGIVMWYLSNFQFSIFNFQ